MQKKWLWGFLILSSVVSANEDLTKNLHNKRYCEILLFKPTEGMLVFNTIKQNDCPEGAWKNLTKDRVKKISHAWSVYFNGPRFWVIDAMKNSSLVDNKVLDIDGFKLNKAAKIPMFSFMKFYFENKKSYQVRQISRNTTWVYNSGTRVYELIDEHNQAYVMQSYSIQYQAQTLEGLKNLGNQLHLPQNWKFKTGVLKKTQTVTAIENQAFVIQDEFRNTYQRASQDLLEDN